MEQLEKIPNIARLSERVIRVLGLNPSKFTLQGTNTYLIGKGPRKVLLDTGEGVADYIPLLQKALDQEQDGSTISKVICTHWHHDHVGGVDDVLKFLASRNIHLNNSSVTTDVIDPVSSSDLTGVFKFLNPEKDDPDTKFQGINDQQEIKVDDQTTLVTLHTPGHTTDHCCFYLKEENTLFTADCVLGQGTAVFEDLGSYIKSLEKQLVIGGNNPSYKIFPGHGPIIEDGPKKIREYIKHRLDREKQIVGVLAGETSGNVNSGVGSGKTAMEIVKVIYAAYPESLHAPAEYQVLLHLKKLEQDGKIKRVSQADEISDVSWGYVLQTQANI
ncbi:hypothetical protein BGZ76_000529 [Entomortierella beljakovae]|nr:hypothetical protein BGZ76_000529 [Entomortierella beljakovae]